MALRKGHPMATETGEGKHVIVALGEEWYAVPVASVETILRDPKPTRIPRTPKMFLGVFESRGKTLGAIDLRTRLELPPQDGDCRHVVVQSAAGDVSLRVDSVVGIGEFDEGSVEPPSTLLNRSDDEFLAGIGRFRERLVAILDVDHIVPESVAKSARNPRLKAA